MVSHALSPVVLILKGLYFGSYHDLAIQHEFSDCRCDIVCIWCNDNFLTRGAAKIKSKQFSEFGSWTKDTNKCLKFSHPTILQA